MHGFYAVQTAQCNFATMGQGRALEFEGCKDAPKHHFGFEMGKGYQRS